MKRIIVLLMCLVMVVNGCASKGSSEEAYVSQRNDTKSDMKMESKETTYAEKDEARVEVEYSTSEKNDMRYDVSEEEYKISTSGETYDDIVESGYSSAYDEPLSTFSVDVDTASYSNVRRYLKDGSLPPLDAVRIEEMINYFDYDFSKPRGNDPFSITTEVGPCPWNEDHNVAMIGLQGEELDLDERVDSNLVFLLDVSGSMNQSDKLPLLKEGLKMLVEELGRNDKVSIVVYAGASGVVLSGADGDETDKIMRRLDNLSAGGSTAGAEGIELAYEVAKDYFIEDGNNRVILATDGDFNVGPSSRGELEALIEEKRDDGIFLSVLGFGTGNTDFVTMETLAGKGNGFFAYIDSIDEAEKVLVKEMAGTLFTIAKDVKIQVEFNPAIVKSYRLIGYENRLLENRDFDNDKIDAGDIGAGHRVTALYELELYRSTEDGITLRYQDEAPRVENDYDEIMFVKLRYKEPDSDRSNLIEEAVDSVKDFSQTSDDYRFALAVAEFGLLLRRSDYMGDADFDHIFETLVDTRKGIEDEYKLEFMSLVGIANGLYR